MCNIDVESLARVPVYGSFCLQAELRLATGAKISQDNRVGFWNGKCTAFILHFYPNCKNWCLSFTHTLTHHWWLAATQGSNLLRETLMLAGQRSNQQPFARLRFLTPELMSPFMYDEQTIGHKNCPRLCPVYHDLQGSIKHSCLFRVAVVLFVISED